MHKSKIAKGFVMAIFILVVVYMTIMSIGWIGKILYPLKYSKYIAYYSEKYDVDPYLVASIIMIESKYDENAKSYKDARGLMQITPSTGQWIARSININRYNDEMLYNPKVNIMMGCWYINNLKIQFDNNINIVLAAYNGGSGNVEKWLKDKKYSKDGINLENIPFKETRNYVIKVNRYYKIYKILYSEEDFI